MKRIISLVLILTLCFPAMPVMAQERTIRNGGLTINIPNGFTSLTQEEAAQTTRDKGGNLLNNIMDAFNVSDAWKFLGNAAALVGSELFADYQYSDGLELIVYDDKLNYMFKIYVKDDSSHTFDDYSYRDYRLGIVTKWSDMLRSEGYSTDKNEAIMRYTSNGIPYVQLDGYSSSKGCCRMAVILYNGYDDRIVFISRKENSISDESAAIFDSLMNSVSVSLSPKKTEGRTDDERYRSIFIDRVELNN